ncbi:MAG: sigma-70 family RNA polymerase sigma factor [Planctomycetaceae bacterium]|nr:sigma-70 family RNA polymerase sigma factor [Planctomycetaceae bacterium]
MSKTVDKQARTDEQPPQGWSAATDEELIAIYKRSGERRAFDELVHRYERELYSYLRRYLGDATLAEDAFQTTFLQVHLKCDQFEEGRKFRPWLYTIATNQAIDTQRRNKRHKLVSLDRRQGRDGGDDLGALLDLLTTKESGPAGEVESTERANWIRRAVSELPETLRAAVTLIYYQGMRYREAADVLGIPVGTVKSRLHTAVLKLNEAWRLTNGAADDDRP